MIELALVLVCPAFDHSDNFFGQTVSLAAFAPFYRRVVPEKHCLSPLRQRLNVESTSFNIGIVATIAAEVV